MLDNASLKSQGVKHQQLDFEIKRGILFFLSALQF